MKQSLRASFTLIEMLIVIVIIGILAAALIPRLQSVQGRARDSKRKVDFREIYNANEIYKIDNGDYVHLHPTDLYYSWQSPAWLTGLKTVMNTVPVDPLNVVSGPAATGGYTYRYRYSVTGYSYSLHGLLENTQDTTRCELKNYVYAHTADPVNGLQVCPVGILPATRYQYYYDPINLKRLN